MEKNSQEIVSINKQSQFSQEISLTSKIKAIGREITHVNQLTPYTLSAEQLVDWAKTIDDVFPNLDVNDLRAVLLDFKTGEIVYDTRQGIQNIFFGLKTNFGGKYTVKK